jgi:uncharacterized protein (TIGR04255 family)
MAAVEHLRNAPIVEAILELRVDLPPDTDPERALRAVDMLRPDFSAHRKHVRGKFEFASGPEIVASAKAHQEPIGYEFLSEDTNRLTRFNVEAFSLHWLKPYGDWESLREKAKSIWAKYLVAFEPSNVTRIGLRYVNNLEMSLPMRDFDEYLTAAPKVPASLPQSLSRFLTSMEIIDDQKGIGATITHALQGVVAPNLLSVILDIDTYRNDACPVDDPKIWNSLETLHTFKNEIFFGCVTDKLLERYK